MSELFLTVLRMSLSASFLVLVVLGLRLVLLPAPKWSRVVLWGMVGVRLVFPICVDSPYSLLPESLTGGALIEDWADDYVGSVRIIHDAVPGFEAAVEAGREPVDAGEGGAYVVTAADGMSEPPTVRTQWVPVLAGVWLSGVAALLLYSLVSYVRLRGRVCTAVYLRDGIYQSEAVRTPFVLGVFPPKIYLPYRIDERDMAYVIAHEEAHIARGDHCWKLLGFLLLSVHWFNPLIWLAYGILCRDIELACDEKVIETLERDRRADYAQALLTCGVDRRMHLACPLAFGEVSVKSRVTSVLKYRKPGAWVVLLASISCFAVALCFLTDQERILEGSYTLRGYGVYGEDDYFLMLDDGLELSCTREQYEDVLGFMEYVREGLIDNEDAVVHVKYDQFLISDKQGKLLELRFSPYQDVRGDGGVFGTLNGPPDYDKTHKTFASEEELKQVIGDECLLFYSEGLDIERSYFVMEFEKNGLASPKLWKELYLSYTMTDKSEIMMRVYFEELEKTNGFPLLSTTGTEPEMRKIGRYEVCWQDFIRDPNSSRMLFRYDGKTYEVTASGGRAEEFLSRVLMTDPAHVPTNLGDAVIGSGTTYTEIVTK